MKTLRLTTILAAVSAAVFMTACAYVPQPAGVVHAVSTDYDASTIEFGLVAYIYGDATVLEFQGRAGVLVLRDPQGNAIEFEREGRYVRLPRIYDAFTAYVNGNPVTFSSTLRTRVFSGPPGRVQADRPRGGA